jgi:hypothetical protein
MESRTRQEDTPACFAIVKYTGASTDPETNNCHGGVLAVNQVPVLMVEDCVGNIGVWSDAQLWKAAGKGTINEFFYDGPFTLHAENGRPADTGNFVVLSYFKAVAENFCARYHLTYKTLLPYLLPHFGLGHDNPTFALKEATRENGLP